MRRYQDQIVFSASDLVTFLGCRHATFLDRRQLDTPVEVAEDDAHAKLLQDKGLEHERRLLERYKAEGKRVAEIPNGPLEQRTAQTLQAMQAGAEIVYQGAFYSGRWHGYADFLIRVEGASNLGAYHYEPLDTKLAHHAKPTHVIQLCVYADLLGQAQGRAPERLHVVLGTGETVALRAADFRYYFAHARGRLEAFLQALPARSEGVPCRACDLCRWRDRCGGEWEAADHLSLVANIRGGQIETLNAAGIMTVAQLGGVPPGTQVPGMRPEMLRRLSDQARLQTVKRETGENQVELLDSEPRKGFERLPEPDAGDLFFDMEGDPLYDGGLEYLFGFAYQDGKAIGFQPFWGHDRAEEKVAFEKAMDFVSARLNAFPDAHIYHYAAYEETALKRLAMLHGTREAEVDNLLRAGKLVDLYRVVKESIRVSEPKYSIKNLEVFYRGSREGAVSNAGESVVVYENWRKLQDSELLKEIEDYNRIDCESTLQLRDWLLSLRPEGMPWKGDRPPDPEEEARIAERVAAEQQNAHRVRMLLQGAPVEERPFRELVGHLLDFHKREAKPAWWFQFTWPELSTEELIDDSQCLAGLTRDETAAPFREKQSTVYTFRFPPQDFKLGVGKAVQRAEPDRPGAGTIFDLDEKAGRIQLKCGRSIEAHPPVFSLMPPEPRKTGVLRDAVQRYADSVVAGADVYPAITAALKRALPRLRGRAPGAPVTAPGAEPVRAAADAIGALDGSYLLVQGPPGAGKTYLSARVIVALLRGGKRVAIAANAHKAINRLLEEVAAVAVHEGVTLRGVKKCSDDDHACDVPGIINVDDNKEVTDAFNLVAGTAWLFARPEHNQKFDYLFVDEAGQISLGHLVAMGTCARNLVLVGDQMQLGQPIQGSHPGESGLSALEFLLKDYATIPPERGIFLDISRRMHPDVCRFISDAVYEGRLNADPSCAERRLALSADADPALKASGVSWVPVNHQDCTQRSEEEGARVASLYQSLLGQRWLEKAGQERPLTADDILIVSPYNMQVNLLQELLPGARVGTVDKFQGQEAAVVIVSMTASSAEDVPRGMEFLYSRNRLNVAISRAKSLAIVVASPRLLEASCTKIEQMALVNMLCHAQSYATAHHFAQ
ncbi:MAG: TM0106 family RecB-like putative nuclease [Proteobacteria bacterium]|nr:TM0106 family RecB-like putative nuclease [Pseudomonadota bacterium]